MKIISWNEFLASDGIWGPLAATVGAFDGLHLGHRLLISRVIARAPTMHTAIITFQDNPKRVLHPKTFHGDLYSLARKLELIRETGAELCVLIDFSSDFGKLTGSGFLSSLRESGGLRYIAMGSDFRCGYKLDTDAEALAALSRASGVYAEVLGPVNWNGKPISSSRIRRSILEGKVLEASHMLGRPYGIDCAGIPCTRSSDGHLSLPVPELAIQPPPGRYTVTLESGITSLSGLADVERGCWEIRVSGEILPETIYFLDTVSRV